MTSSSAATRVRKKSLGLAVVAALCGAGVLDAGAATSGANAFATIAHSTVLSRGDAVMGALPMSQPIRVSVALKLRNKDVLDAFVANNAKNQTRGVAAQLMTSDQYFANHAPSQAQAQAVANYLAGMGFRNVVIAPNRLAVTANGTALTARNAFLTTFAQVKTYDGRVAYANTGDVRMPSSLQGSVLAVVGLQTVHQMRTFAPRLPHGGGPHPLRVPLPTTAPVNPSEFPSIYGATPTTPGTYAGARAVDVGIVTDGNLTQTIADLKTAMNSPTRNFAIEEVDNADCGGSVPCSADTSNASEWDLDSQAVVGITGQIGVSTNQLDHLIFYDIPDLNPGSVTDDLIAIQSANVAKVVVIPVGECETDAQGDGSQAADDATLELAVAQGQTFVAAAGNIGADECSTGGTTPSYPASSPYVIAVGGTTLSVLQDPSGPNTDAYSSELVWANTGGSQSGFEPAVGWQTGVLTALGVNGTGPFGTSFRGVPDVAFDADPASGASIIVNGAPTTLGDTSLSASLFAGMWASVLTVRGTGFGFAGAVIYALPVRDFNDVTSGSNGGETAGVGYDLASGLGSMNFNNVIADSKGLGNKPPVANFTYSTASSSAIAVFADTSTDSDGTVVKWKWNFGDGTSSTAQSPSHTYATSGNANYKVTETVFDNDGASSSKTSWVTVNPQSAALNLIINNNFTSGGAPWTYSKNTVHPVDYCGGISPGEPPFTPSAICDAWLDGTGTAHTDVVSQQLTMPTGRTSVTVNFLLHVDTADPGTRANDILRVEVYSATGVLLETIASYSNLTSTFGENGYTVAGGFMTYYPGQTVTLKFIGVENGSLQTSFAIDNVSVRVF